MKRYFLDSSAVVKLYVAEPGSDTVRQLVRSASRTPEGGRVLVCDLALPETVSALQQIAGGPAAARKGISKAALRQTLPRIRADFQREGAMLVHPVSACMEEATSIVERQQLRPSDALHVASALLARQMISQSSEFTFVSADIKQGDAARREGLSVLPLPGD